MVVWGGGRAVYLGWGGGHSGDIRGVCGGGGVDRQFTADITRSVLFSLWLRTLFFHGVHFGVGGEVL